MKQIGAGSSTNQLFLTDGIIKNCISLQNLILNIISLHWWVKSDKQLTISVFIG